MQVAAHSIERGISNVRVESRGLTFILPVDHAQVR